MIAAPFPGIEVVSARHREDSPNAEVFLYPHSVNSESSPIWRRLRANSYS